MLFFFFKEVSYAHASRLHLFDQKYSKNSNIVKCYYTSKYGRFSILIYFKMQFIFFMAKLNFKQPLYFSLQCHKKSVYADSLSVLETVVLLNIFWSL